MRRRDGLQRTGEPADERSDREGDLRGIAPRIAEITALGVDAPWLTPSYPPLAAGRYGISDHLA